METIYNKDFTYNEHACKLETKLRVEGLESATGYVVDNNLDIHQAMHLLSSMISSEAARLIITKRLELC